ncbi:ABC transporter permease [Alkaliphilus peptidifermentans]|uniref:Putative ABC transport system permease protein n=1 Tax=Alkaliphilus peptidifermentans DSM 18978 TaxID=1120976 RepID=A0A1G5G1R7_9FIRM|nr:FtsX-like permease family protein [Alkaliphilus peptidifermentans]SCY45502.1 putative ABC transport system permease protein [Alkaliphilus peptidifermentans DSM 18978]
MNLFQIALNNLRRRKVKMIFLMLGLVVGVSTVVGFLNIIQAMHLELGDRIDEFGANAIILPRSEGMEMHYSSTVVSDLTFDVEKLTIEDIPKIYDSSVQEYINIVSPKLVGAVDAGNQKALIVGVEGRQEFIQKPWFSLQQQANLEPGESVGDLALLDIPEDGIVVGSSAATTLGVAVGEQLIINNRPFQVFGILNQLGSEEDGLIYANLEVVQDLLNRPQELSMIEISAYCNACPIEEIAMGLEDALPNSRVIPMRQAALFREETIEQFSVFGYALSGMVLLIAALVVLTTMLSSVNERTREIGIFRAIGFRRSDILKIIFMEAGMISILGGLVGFFSGSFAAMYAGPYLAQLQGAIPMQFQLLLPAILLSTGLTMLVSVYPAMKAAQLDPAEALRFI